MRFIIMHTTNAHWESGAVPGRALIARVGELVGELSASGVLLGAEGPGLTVAAIEASDTRVVIPMRRGVDSLNVANAAAVATG